MVKNIKNVIKTAAIVLGGSFMVLSCESESDNLGSQFFQGGMADGSEHSEDVVAYNILHNDTIRTDATKLTSAQLGAFTESQFGKQKASYVTQVRMGSYAPDFGTNPVVDSVVLVLKPAYAKDSVTTKTYDDYTYPVGNVAAKKVVNTYPIVKYGKTKHALTLNVHEVTDFLGGASDAVYSNKNVATGAVLASVPLNGTLTSVNITSKTDNSVLLTRDANLRIPLDKSFFQNKILAKGGAPELSDASNFIRYFKGLKLSVAENDGYLFKFNPNDAELVMYYKRDVTTNGTATPTPTSFTFSLGSGNVHFSQIEYDRAASSMAGLMPDNTLGDPKLYAQGMGGPGIGIRIPAATVEKIRNLYKTQNIGILSAKIRLYTDASVWKNPYERPPLFTIEQKGATTFLDDLTMFSQNSVFNLVKAYPDYYDFTITQTFKNIVEKAAENKDFVINVGSYEASDKNALIAPAYNTRPYAPHRIILVGSDKNNANRAQLKITYTKK